MNNYHIYEEVGRGNHSVVYKGRKKKSIEYVAVKSVERGRRKKFMDEVGVFQTIQNDHIKQQQFNGALSNANTRGLMSGSDEGMASGGSSPSSQQSNLTNWHPNIIKFHNWYETRNHYWIIFEYCVGGTLFQLLKTDEKLPEDTVKKFAYEILEGLSYLHSQGIIFGDLRPQNILLNEYHKLKLSDFGLSKKVAELGLGIKNSAEDRASAHLQANQPSKTSRGTPAYMAPELLHDSGVYSYQSDFWSLGCILVEMATGKPPFATNDHKDLMKDIMNQEIQNIKGFTALFNNLVQRLLQKDPVFRCTWDEIKDHEWFSTPLETSPEKDVSKQQTPGAGHFSFGTLKKQTYKFTKRIYQPQPQFDRYLLQVRNISQQEYQKIKSRQADKVIAQPVVPQNTKKPADQVAQKGARRPEEERAFSALQTNQQNRPKSSTGMVGSNNKKTSAIEPQARQIPENVTQVDFYGRQNRASPAKVNAAAIRLDQHSTSPINAQAQRRQEFGEAAAAWNNSSHKKQNQSRSRSRGDARLFAGKQPPAQVPKNDFGGQAKRDNFFMQGTAGSPSHDAIATRKQQTPQQPALRKISPKPPQVQTHPMNAGQQEAIGTGGGFNQTQQIFKNKALVGNMTGYVNQPTSSFSAANPSSLIDKQDVKLKLNSGVPRQKTIQPEAEKREIDRFDFLNDDFDDDPDDDDRVPVENAGGVDEFDPYDAHDDQAEPNGATCQVFKYHEPLEGERAFQTLEMTKDTSLFNSRLSQAQIKSETQQLVTYTVQIGPVQNQSISSNSGKIGQEDLLNQGMTSRAKTAMHSTLDQTRDKSSTEASSQGATTRSYQMPTQMKVPHKTIDQLLIHQSDTAVKPIVGNKEIERIQDQPLNASYLNFTPWSSDEVIEKINSTQIESHLSDVYNSIASNTTINEKISTLQYFESIIVNSNVSNSLINSAFMSLLKRLLEQINSPMIKIRVCSVVGLLIRHSTIIDNDLAEIDIASQLIGTLRDSNELVRRRAIAALGEYMFYAATQLDDEMADPVWELSDDAIDIIVQSLDDAETDHIVRFYACKTLENICAQSQSAGCRFATSSTIKRVLNIFTMEKEPWAETAAQNMTANETGFNSNRPVSAMSSALTGRNQTYQGGYDQSMGQEQPQDQQQFQSYLQWYEGIRISAAIALSHICKLKPELFPEIFEALGATQFCDVLLHGAGQYRVQQAFVFMLNLALHNIQSIGYTKISEVLLKEPKFFQALEKLLEHQHIVIRGKCIMTILLLFNLDFRWITAVQQQIKFFNELDKLLKDNYKYVQCSLLCLAEGVQEIVPTIFKSIADQLSMFIQCSKMQPEQLSQYQQKLADEEDPTNLNFITQLTNQKNMQLNDFSKIAMTQLFHVSILLDLQINPLVRSRLLSTPSIQAVAAMLDLCDVNSFKGADQFMNGLLTFCENLPINQMVLQILAVPIQQQLMPVLLDKLTNTESDEIRTLCFKIYTDIMVQLLANENVFVSCNIFGASRLDAVSQRRQQSPVKQPLTMNDRFANDSKSGQTGETTELICLHIKDHLLPQMMTILRDSMDPLPLFGLKLLSAIADHDAMVLFQPNLPVHNSSRRGGPQAAPEADYGLSLRHILSQFFSLENQHSRLNRYTINLMRQMVLQKEELFPLHQMAELGIVQNTTQIIRSMQMNEQSESLEIMLDILNAILERLNDFVKRISSKQARQQAMDQEQEQQFVSFLVNQSFDSFEDCIQLLRLAEYDCNFNLVDKSSQALIWMLQLFAQLKVKQRDIFFVEAHFPLLLLGLKCGTGNLQSLQDESSLEGSIEDSRRRQQNVQKKMLKCVYWALIQNESEYRIDIGKVDQNVIMEIDQWLQQILQSSNSASKRDKPDGFKKMCLEVQRILQNRVEEFTSAKAGGIVRQGY